MSIWMKLCFIVLLKLFFILVCNAEQDYFDSSKWKTQDKLQDPHSFYYDKHTQKEIPPAGINDNHEVGAFTGGAGDASSCYAQLHKCKTAKNTDVDDALLSRRFINMLVSRTKFKKETLYFSGRIHLEATPAQYEALKNFGLGKLTLREVDSILDRVLQSPPFDPVQESAMWIKTAASFMWHFLIQHKEWVVGVIALTWLYWMLRGTRFNFFIVMTIGVQFILVASFFITWWKLIQDARIQHASIQVKNMELPVQCQPHKMGWMDKLRSFFYTDDCEPYFIATMRDPLLQVTPAQAMAHMLGTMLWEPLAMSGKTIGRFLEQLTAHMPRWMSYAVQLAICLGILPTIVIFIILLLGGNIKLGMGPFSMFSLNGPRDPDQTRPARLESNTARQPIEVMLKITTNVEHTPSVTNAPVRSNNLSITACPECSRQENNDTSSTQAATSDEQAVGDSGPMTKAGSSKSPAKDNEVEGGVRKRKIVELGSGDCQSFIID